MYNVILFIQCHYNVSRTRLTVGVKLFSAYTLKTKSQLVQQVLY